MTATNHAMTGAVIGLTLTNPWTAVPLAFVSHFVLDSLPHYGEGNNPDFLTTRRFRTVLYSDTVLLLAFLAALCIVQPAQWWLALLAALAAISPDTMWISDYVTMNRGQPRKPFRERSLVVQFHKWIQWCERPIGAFVEVVWAIICGAVLLSLISP